MKSDGSIVRATRILRFNGMTQTALAQKVNRGVATIGRLEDDNPNISLEVKKDVARALQLEFDFHANRFKQPPDLTDAEIDRVTAEAEHLRAKKTSRRTASTAMSLDPETYAAISEMAAANKQTPEEFIAHATKIIVNNYDKFLELTAPYSDESTRLKSDERYIGHESEGRIAAKPQRR